MKWALTHCQIFVTIKSLNNLSPDWPLSDFYKKKTIEPPTNVYFNTSGNQFMKRENSKKKYGG